MASKPRRDNAAKGKTFPHRRGSDAHHLPDSLFADQYDPDNVVPIGKAKRSKQTVTEQPRAVLSAQSASQKPYIRDLENTELPIVMAVGPAGTGKTYPAVVFAIREFQAGRIKKIIITRPNVDSGDPLGHLPGSLNEKMGPWVVPIIDIFEEFFTVQQVKLMLEHKQIEFAPFAYMRGRTFKNALVILDEGQNTTVEQMTMFLTRIGEGTRMIITGDPKQHDRGPHGVSGLVDLLRRLENRAARQGPMEGIGITRYTDQDVVRHPIITPILGLYA